MATWETERSNLSAALTATFKKTGTGAYQYTEVDTDITSETNIPIGQKKRYYRIFLTGANKGDLTSGMTIGRYICDVKFYFISAKFDFEVFKSECITHLGVLLNTYNYNLLATPEFEFIDSRQGEMTVTLEVGLSYTS